MTKVLHVLIHLTEPNLSRAAKAVHPKPKRALYELMEDYRDRVKESRKARKAFVGPQFDVGVKTIQCSEGTLDVVLDDGTVYMYPLGTVARCKAWKTETPPTPPVAPDFLNPDNDIPF